MHVARYGKPRENSLTAEELERLIFAVRLYILFRQHVFFRTKLLVRAQGEFYRLSLKRQTISNAKLLVSFSLCASLFGCFYPTNLTKNRVKVGKQQCAVTKIIELKYTIG